MPSVLTADRTAGSTETRPCDPLTRGQLGTEGHGMSAAPIAASTAWPLELHAHRGRDLAEVQQRQRIEELAEVTVAP